MLGNGKGPAGYVATGSYEDFRGGTITEGVTVVYAALKSRSCQLVEAVVHAIFVQERQIQREDWEWQYDSVQYTTWQQDPNRVRVVTRRWVETVYDYKLQLLPTERTGRFKQHWGDVKPVWVMAEQAVKV